MAGNVNNIRAEPVTRLGAKLHLMSALKWAADNERPTQWAKADWHKLMRVLAPFEVAIVAMIAIRGMNTVEVGEWFGVSRWTICCRWNEALRKLKRQVEG